MNDSGEWTETNVIKNISYFRQNCLVFVLEFLILFFLKVFCHNLNVKTGISPWVVVYSACEDFGMISEQSFL